MPGAAFAVSGAWDSREVTALLSAIDARQRRFALSYGVNLTAKAVKTAEREALDVQIDRPTPYTSNSLFMAQGSKDKPEARVGFKDRDFGGQKGTPAGVYLMPQVYGGSRSPKRFERAMQYAGYITGSEYLIPASGIELDRYGNVPNGMVTKIMSGLKVGFAPRARSPRSVKKNNQRFFFGRIDGHLGVWERVEPGHVKPMFIVHEGAPHYKQAYSFFQIGEDTVNAQLLDNMEFAINRAIETARSRP